MKVGAVKAKDTPLVAAHRRMRPIDRDLIRGGHYGQRLVIPPHMVRKLANSTTKRIGKDEELRKAVRPVLADVGETAQFLGMKGTALNNEARDRFLDFLYDDLSEALKRLIRISEGDYSPDKYRERFPKFEGADTDETPWQLFEKWVAERQPRASSVENWRYVFRKMSEHLKDRSAATITVEEAQQWVDSLKTITVKKNWLNASKTVLRWAVEQKLIPSNPFAKVRVTVPKQIRLRETQAFRSEEWQ